MRNRPIVPVAAFVALFALQAHAMPQQSPTSTLAAEPVASTDADDDMDGARDRPRFVIAFRDRPAPDQDISKDNCLRFTGSRLMRDDRENQRCAHAPGFVLMREDLDLQGAGSLADFVR